MDRRTSGGPTESENIAGSDAQQDDGHSLEKEQTLILIEHLIKRYGNVTAVDDLSLSIESGQVYGLLGPNGAGKTTTVRILSTLTQPTSGSASINGCDVAAHPLDAKAHIGVVHQTLNFDPELTGSESLLIHGLLFKMPMAEIRKKTREMLEFADLVDVDRRPVGKFSGGMKRRLSIARALIHDPPVLLLDEPTVGLDAHARRKVWELIRRLRDIGRTIVLTSHYIDEVELLADRVAVIDQGRLIAEGTPAELIEGVGKVVLDIHHSTHTEYCFFNSREEAARRAAHLNVATTIRNANLEDVFVRITGRYVNPSSQEEKGGPRHASGHGGHSARAHHS
jgi:ABC-2 type transport system ATP-binding protein